ncbi:GGDEF domain-containing protein [Vibrio sinensis]|uniref:diguanylate cyclase n=1 Tax=Vibrio sinensis TaxID=2302434 RepID=A0A3A6QAL6_9VIBR|nr:GGDEF domain-containing protein [Vibrio sinensis]RJX67523.1 GGDEF domain-containing protein [Vibrio sinensis]
MGVLEQDIQSQLHNLKSQLEKVRLTHRDTSFKFKREQKVLKRIITSLSDACVRDDPRLRASLAEICQALEQNKDISSLIPKFAVLERLSKQQMLAMKKDKDHLDTQIKNSGEMLLRVVGLPAKIKRDLRDLLSFSGTKNMPQAGQTLQLLSIYERAVKILTSNPSSYENDITSNADKELILRLNHELQLLITELDFDGESGELLIDIRAKLLIGVSTQALLELTLQILKLVIQGTHFERKTSQQFLEQINSSLASTLKSNAQIVDQSQSYFEQRKEYNGELSELINESQTAVNNAEEIEQLRNSVNPLLDQIASLSERLNHAEQREETLIERMVHSNNQLEAMYETTQDYRRRLEDQAQRMLQDPLTKLYNRTAFAERLELEYRRWIRSQHNFRIVLLDIDSFKAINDSFGYTAGDKALKIIARTIEHEVSKTDTVARFSGEEFILLLPERSDSDCFELVANIQKQVSKLPFKFRDQNLMITLSGSGLRFKDSDTPEEVLDRLNIMLKEAKALGANQLIWK